MKALRRFTVRAALPAPLSPLAELVMNLRWSWHPDSLDLFASVDPHAWSACEGDPNRLLGEVSAERLAALARDEAFLARLGAASADLHAYLTDPRWYQSLSGGPSCIAYFSPEFGITEVLPQYSGGLGILAGDHLKAASDLGVPIIGVGLLYRSGYFEQSLSGDGWQQERYPSSDPYGLPLTALLQRDGTPVTISVPLPGERQLHAQVWVAQVGRVPLLLLDSDVEANGPAERAVTDRLYGGGAEHRLLQELLLGVGGVRALRAYAAANNAGPPEVFHTNEGHAGFLGIERIRELTAAGLSFDEALEAVRAGTVFTTHTPVAAGIDRFPQDLVREYFGAGSGWSAEATGMPVERLLALGAEPDGDANVFNMACMGLRLAQRANGVSQLHGDVSRAMFAALWPGFETAEVPIGAVTNGVHAPTWTAREMVDLAGRQQVEVPADESTLWQTLADAPAADLWAARGQMRERLVGEVRRRVEASCRARGAAAAELAWTADVFDPAVLTIGFARRVPSYKRLTLMLRNPDRLRALLLDRDRPVQLVIAGKSHPADDGGKQLIQQIVRFADDASVRHRIAFLPNYDIGMARYLYAGCDVWLNNPLRPLEACGTSGMKAALNGALNLSVRDGWWDEMYDGQNGWEIPSAEVVGDQGRRDDLEATALYELLEGQVRGRFYDVDGDGVPQRWVAMVRHTLRTLGPKVLASRMLRDYVGELYVPAAESARRMSARSHAGARELAAWRDAVSTAWPHVRVEHVESGGVGDTPQLGEQVAVRAVVQLAELSPDDVVVQAVCGRVDDTDVLHGVSLFSLRPVGEDEHGGYVFEGAVPLERTGAFGYTVRVLPRHALLASAADLGLAVCA